MGGARKLTVRRREWRTGAEDHPADCVDQVQGWWLSAGAGDDGQGRASTSPWRTANQASWWTDQSRHPRASSGRSAGVARSRLRA